MLRKGVKYKSIKLSAFYNLVIVLYKLLLPSIIQYTFHLLLSPPNLLNLNNIIYPCNILPVISFLLFCLLFSSPNLLNLNNIIYPSDILKVLFLTVIPSLNCILTFLNPVLFYLN